MMCHLIGEDMYLHKHYNMTHLVSTLNSVQHHKLSTTDLQIDIYQLDIHILLNHPCRMVAGRCIGSHFQ